MVTRATRTHLPVGEGRDRERRVPGAGAPRGEGRCEADSGVRGLRPSRLADSDARFPFLVSFRFRFFFLSARLSRRFLSRIPTLFNFSTGSYHEITTRTSRTCPTG